MSYGIIRVAKVATGAIGGAQIHNDRLSDHSNTNPDIDFSRSQNNRKLPLEKDFLEKLPYHKRINEVLRTERQDTKTIRKDAVKMCEVLVTSDSHFFDSLTAEQVTDFFDTAYAFLCDRYGRKNIIAATVHMDERTPHMHVDFVPVTKDGRLSAKEVVVFQKDLSRLHDDFFQHVGKRFGLERGQKATETGEKKYNRSVAEFKRETDAAQKALEASQTVDTVQPRKIPLSNALAVPESDWKRMQEENKAARVVLSTHKEVTEARQEIVSLCGQQDALKAENQSLSAENSAVEAAVRTQKRLWLIEQENTSAKTMGMDYTSLQAAVKQQQSAYAQNEVILENQHRQMETAKEELNEINRELQQKRPEYKRSIAERMDAAVWQQRYSEFEKDVHDFLIKAGTSLRLDLPEMFKDFQKRQQERIQDERGRGRSR